ncbi:MAG: glucose-1-phosphate adenylyltransferase, partial [Thermoplasmata archaeon]|nr:glucose-1-phosphate adenylyltransferase [Thermoplasmata archaeon]
LVQYKSQSLIEHIRKNWVLSPVVTSHFIALVPPQMKIGPEWFQGTADAVFQNVNLISDQHPDLVVVFGADHIYRMDIRQMVDFHLTRGADVTVAARPVPLEEASAFGVLKTDEDNRIIGFQEKPKKPSPMPDRPDMAYVSMGNYIFGRDILLKSLSRAQRHKQHDFGAHILPDLVHRKKKVFAYDFATNVIPGVRPYEEVGYWRDVGTIQAYFNAHMDMIGAKPRFDPFNEKWPVHSGGYIGASAQVVKGELENTSIAEGAVIDGAKIKNSVLRSGVRVGKGSVIENCIIMDNVHIKERCTLKNVIVDKSNVIENREKIGFDMEADRFRCHIDTTS